MSSVELNNTGSGNGRASNAPSLPQNDKQHKAPDTKAGLAFAIAFLVSLVFVFLGERVFASSNVTHYGLSGLGVLGAVGATVLRFGSARKHGGDRGASERTLSLFQLLGLLALGIYFGSSTETGKNIFGIASRATETRAKIEAVALILWTSLLGISIVPLLLGERALSPMRDAEHIEGRRVRAAVVSGLTLAFAAVYSALFTYGATGLDIKHDYSLTRSTLPSEATKNVTGQLNEPVKVTAFFPQLNDVGAEVEAYLREVSGPKLQVEFQDRLLAPALAKEAKVTQDGVLVLMHGTARETLTIGSEMKAAAAKLKTLDSDFQKALIKTIRSQRTAYLTIGHGELNEATTSPEERTTKKLKKLIESQNYVVKDLGMQQGLAREVPDDATVIAILGPTQNFLPEELAALKRYADRGGKLLLALDPDAQLDLQPLAALASVTIKKGLVVDSKNYYPRRKNPSDQAVILTNRYSSHASVSTLSRNSTRAILVVPSASPLDKLDGSDAKLDFVVKSMGSAFIDEDSDFAKGGNEKEGTYNIAAAVTRPGPKKDDKSDKGKEDNEFRAFVIGDVDAVNDFFLGNQANLILAGDAIRWLGGEESFSGSIAANEDVRVEHTKEKDQLWFYGIIFGAPSLLLAVGLVISRRKPSRRAA